jgi:AbrB family looped-hinge helix DNA binding protein
MAATQTVTMDSSGRIVVPKALRAEFGVEPGQPLRARVTDGRLEIEPCELEADLVESDGLLVIVAREPVPPLSRDAVRDLLDDVRR